MNVFTWVAWDGGDQRNDDECAIHTHTRARAPSSRKTSLNKRVHLHWMCCHCHCYGLNVICAGFQCERIQETASFQSTIKGTHAQRHTNAETYATINVKQFTLMFHTSVLSPHKRIHDGTRNVNVCDGMRYAVKLWCLLITSVWLLINQETKDQIVFISQLVSDKVAQVHREENVIRKISNVFFRPDFPKSIQWGTKFFCLN